MNPRPDVRARIHRVHDYVIENLDGDLSLAVLARIACFSPFYFHRLHLAITGETLNEHVGRVRIEQAAARLVNDPDRPITEIALDCGFSTSANFARAFRAGFGTAPGAYRKIRMKKSKLRVASSSATGETSARSRRGRTGRRTAMKVEIRTMPERRVAYIRHTGEAADHDSIGRAFDRVCAWAQSRGHMGPETLVMGATQDDPAVTPGGRWRYDACVTVPPGAKAEGDIGIRTLPGGLFAVCRFEGPIAGIPGAWERFMKEWFPASGFRPDDRPCMEIYLNDPRKHPKGHCVMEMCESVRAV